MSRQYCRTKWVGVIAVCTLGLLTTFALGAPRAEAAGVVSCPATITSCGCTITDATLHLVGANLDASQGLNKDGSCINIKHSFATLDLDDYDVDGTGTGIGVHILKSAKRVSVQNWAEINDWDVAIQDDGSGALISSCGGCDTDGNSTAGVFLNKVKRSVVTGFDMGGNGTGVLVKSGGWNQIDALDDPDGCEGDTANGTGIALIRSKGNTVQSSALGNCGLGNTGDGILLDHSNNNSINTSDTDDNGGNGYNLVQSNNNSISDFESNDNGANGIKLDRSSKNFIGDYQSASNAGDGLLVDAGSNQNTSYDADKESNGLNGTEISAGDKSNSVTYETSVGNSTDLVDGNTNCDKDVWSNLCFNTASQSCIGTPATRCF